MLSTFFLLLLFAQPGKSLLSVTFPDLVNINTGSNMTVFFTSDAIADLPISSDAPYMVAISSSIVFVEVHLLLPEDLLGGQQSLAVWEIQVLQN